MEEQKQKLFISKSTSLDQFTELSWGLATTPDLIGAKWADVQEEWLMGQARFFFKIGALTSSGC